MIPPQLFLIMEPRHCITGAKVETAVCEPECHKPPADCVFSDWSAWSTCDKECGGGQRIRTRTILENLVNGGKACEGIILGRVTLAWFSFEMSTLMRRLQEDWLFAEGLPLLIGTPLPSQQGC